MSVNYVHCFFSFDVKEKFVGPVKNLQDQWILGVTGPTGSTELALRPAILRPYK